VVGSGRRSESLNSYWGLLFYAGIESIRAKTTITHSFATGDGARGNGILSKAVRLWLEDDVVCAVGRNSLCRLFGLPS